VVLLDILTRVGPETVERFAYAWHGPPQLAPAEVTSFSELPGPLSHFYGIANRWPRLLVQNELVDPPEREGDKVMFYVENQGVCVWMTDLSSNDPPVWGSHDGENFEEGEPLSSFLVQVVIFEAVMGAQEGASTAALETAKLDSALGGLSPLPLAPWHWPEYPTRFYASDEALAIVTPSGNEWVSIHIGALKPEGLAHLDGVVDERWAWFSRAERPLA
jgi:hypothetical protein